MAAISADQQQIRLLLQGFVECLSKQRQRCTPAHTPIGSRHQVWITELDQSWHEQIEDGQHSALTLQVAEELRADLAASLNKAYS